MFKTYVGLSRKRGIAYMRPEDGAGHVVTT